MGLAALIICLLWSAVSSPRPRQRAYAHKRVTLAHREAARQPDSQPSLCAVADNTRIVARSLFLFTFAFLASLGPAAGRAMTGPPARVRSNRHVKAHEGSFLLPTSNSPMMIFIFSGVNTGRQTLKPPTDIRPPSPCVLTATSATLCRCGERKSPVLRLVKAWAFARSRSRTHHNNDVRAST